MHIVPIVGRWDSDPAMGSLRLGVWPEAPVVLLSSFASGGLLLDGSSSCRDCLEIVADSDVDAEVDVHLGGAGPPRRLSFEVHMRAGHPGHPKQISAGVVRESGLPTR